MYLYIYYLRLKINGNNCLSDSKTLALKYKDKLLGYFEIQSTFHSNYYAYIIVS